MTEREICISYKGARKPNEQTEILAELNGTDKIEIIKILAKNDVELAWPTVRYLHRRLDQLNKLLIKKERERSETMEGSHCKVPDKLNREIADGECEYKKIAEILNMVKA